MGIMWNKANMIYHNTLVSIVYCVYNSKQTQKNDILDAVLPANV